MDVYGYAANSGGQRDAQTGFLSATQASLVTPLNRRADPTLPELIQRMDHATGKAAMRASLAEELADLLCGSRPTEGEVSGKDMPPMSLLSQVEHAISRGEQVNARLDAALHRISRRLKAAGLAQSTEATNEA